MHYFAICVFDYLDSKSTRAFGLRNAMSLSTIFMIKSRVSGMVKSATANVHDNVCAMFVHALWY